MQASENIQKLIISYFTGSLSEEEARDLISWLEKSDENRKYFIELKQTWELTGIITGGEFHEDEGFSAIQNKIMDRGIRKIPAREIRIRRSGIIKIAASVVFLFTAAAFTLMLFDRKNTFNEDTFFEAIAPKGSSFHLFQEGAGNQAEVP